MTPGDSPVQSQDRRCVACGRAIDWAACYCPYCGHDFRCPLGPGRKKEASSTLKIGGYLTMLSGLLAFVEIGVLAFWIDFYDLIHYSSIGICLLVVVPLGALAFIGGWCAVNRKHPALAIAGSVCGIFAVGLGFTSVLALVGLILIIISRDEFEP